MTPVRVRYQTFEFGTTDVHLRTLRSLQEFSDADGTAQALGISSASWSAFGVVWTASEVLASLMAEREIEGLRILEVGCGIALASHVLNHRNADITTTDRHPEAEHFLHRNSALNECAPIPFVRTEWEDEDPRLGKFDLIIGSDILYEPAHVAQLSAFVDRHAQPTCEVVIVDPGRGNHARFSKRMVQLGYAHVQRRAERSEWTTGKFGGFILNYARGSTG